MMERMILPATPDKPWRRRLRRANHEPAPWVYHVIAHLAHAVLPLVARRHWSGQENIPRTGPAIIVANHISNADPVILGEFVIWGGRWPRFLGKADLWKVPVLGWVARQCEQIPVHRRTHRAQDSLVHAERALRKGQVVAIYPEGTITADPDTWPMTGRRGAARLALMSGAPVIPVAQMGAQLILGQKKVQIRRLFGRRRDLHLVAGEPIDLDRHHGLEPTVELQDEVTGLFLDVITGMVADLKGEAPPEGRYDIRVGRRVSRPPTVGQ